MRKQIKDFENYTIDENGNIFNSKGLQLKPQFNIDGYLVVNLCKDGKYKHLRVNRLVALTFLPNPEDYPVVNHIDHDKTNNKLSNLEWCTVKYNTRESVRLQPEKHKYLATITSDQAHSICKMIEQGSTNKDICETLNVSRDVVKKIREGRSWREVSCNYKMMRCTRTISEATARWVIHKIKEGLSNSEILSQSTCSNLNRGIIKSIRCGKSWSSLSKEVN